MDNVTEISDCTMGEDTPCLNAYCGPNSTHHKEVSKISRQLMRWREQNITGESVKDYYIVTLWTDREYGTYCYYHWSDSADAYIHEYMNSYAVVMNHNPAIHILNIADTTTEQRIPHMSILLAHELAHCFGACDLYLNQRPPEHQNDGEWQCLVDIFETENDAAIDFYNGILAGTVDPFCDYCKDAIESGLFYWPNVG